MIVLIPNNLYMKFLFALQFSEIFGKYINDRSSTTQVVDSLTLTTAFPYHNNNENYAKNSTSSSIEDVEVADTRTLPPKVVGGAIGGGLGGGVGGAVGGGVGYLFGGPIGGGVGGAIGGGKRSRKGVGGAIGGKIGGGNGAAIGAGIGGALGGGIGGFIAGPIGGGLGGLLGGGVGGAVGASELPEVITHEENVPGFPKTNVTIIFVPNDDDDNDSTTESPNFAERIKNRIDKIRNRLTNLVTT